MATKKRLWKSLKYQGGEIVSYFDQSEWTVGEWRNNPYTVTKACEGLNCCQHITDAMGYVRCEILAEVVIRGKQIDEDTKITVQEMKIIRAWKWSPLDSVALAIYAAELVIEHYEQKYPNDKRPRNAIDAAKAYLKNPTNDSAYAAANAANAAANASKQEKEKAREEMKTKIDKWIINHLKGKEQVQ